MKPREFWIFTDLNSPQGIDDKALVYHYKPIHPAISGTAIHVREVVPFDGFKPEDFYFGKGSPFMADYEQHACADRANAILREKGLIE